MIDFLNYPKFTYDEMKCQCGCGRANMDLVFMDTLSAIRWGCGFPFPVNSGFRCKRWDDLIGGAGVHPKGKGIDIQIYGPRAWMVFELAFKKGSGVTGIGIKQDGPWGDRFIHMDSMPGSKEHPRPRVWTYPTWICV